MQATTASTRQVAHWRLCLLAASYLLILLGALSILSTPLYVPLLFMLFGATFAAIAAFRTPSIKPPPMTKLSWIILLAGFGILMAVLGIIGEDTVRHWTPHPAGYGVAWFACFQAFRHFRHISPTIALSDL